MVSWADLTTFSLASPLGAAAAYLALAVSLFVLGESLLLRRQAKLAHREDLVLLLALAAHVGVSPDSPEFKSAQQALEARQAGRHWKAPAADGAGAEAKVPRLGRKERKAQAKAAKAAAKAAKAKAKAAS